MPLIITGVQVDPVAIAKPLIFLMLIPLAISMLFKYRYNEISDHLQPFFSKTSSFALLVIIISFVVVYFYQMVSTVGTTAILASVIILLFAFSMGYLLGGKDKPTKRTLAVGSSQRNLAAAFAIATTNFSNPEVLTMIVIFGIAGLIIIMPLGTELGKKAKAI